MFILILIIIITFIVLYLLIFKKSNFELLKPDVVITWVENNENFIKEKSKWEKIYKLESNVHHNHDRYNDNQELKYCLRSIEKYLKNYNFVYLIVKDDQFPKYLKTNAKNFKVIKHSEIIPKEYLPTFNSHSIECFLHHIPNLREYYLYFNDDMILNKNIDSFSLIMDNGTPFSLISNNNELDVSNVEHEVIPEKYSFADGYKFNLQILKYMNIKQNIHHISHIPKIYKKSYDFMIEKFFKNYNNLFDSTAKSKFRKNDNLFLVSLLKEQIYKNFFNGKFKKVKEIILNFRENENIKKNEIIKLDDADFICTNTVKSDFYETYKINMEKILPKKSSYEL